MRINKQHIQDIKNQAEDVFNKDVKVYLFGSRVDDSKKGGDIDLYIETNIKEKLFDKKIKMLSGLMKNLGEQKIDLLINNFTEKKLIYSVAKNEGILL